MTITDRIWKTTCNVIAASKRAKIVSFYVRKEDCTIEIKVHIGNTSLVQTTAKISYCPEEQEEVFNFLKHNCHQKYITNWINWENPGIWFLDLLRFRTVTDRIWKTTCNVVAASKRARIVSFYVSKEDCTIEIKAYIGNTTFTQTYAKISYCPEELEAVFNFLKHNCHQKYMTNWINWENPGIWFLDLLQ